MNASRGVKRKRGSAKPLQVKSQDKHLPEQILPGKLHHSLQEFKRLAKHAKSNETRIIVKKLKSLRSSPDRPRSAKTDPTKTLQDLEAQLAALKVLNLAQFAAAALIQKLRHNRILSADKTVSEFISTELQPSLPLSYYSIQPSSAEGKIRNRLTSCKSFSGRASEAVTDLHAILDPSLAKSSGPTARYTTEGDDSEDLGGGEDEFFDQEEFSDDQVDDDANGWESGSVHTEYEGPPTTLASTGSDFNSESDSNHDGSPPHRKARSKVEFGSESISEDSGGDSTLDSSLDSDSDTSLSSPFVQRKTLKHSGGTGTSTFLPSLSVGYIPGTGDSDPEDELEAVEGKDGRKNRRGQRARRAIWEKKYGRGAKHLVKQYEEEAEKKRIKEEKYRQREAAAKRPHWAAKKVFMPPKQTDSGYQGRIAAKSGVVDGGGRVHGRPPLKKPRQEERALHPSWEAKKRLKKKESAAIIPPVGKKIVF